MSDFSSRLTQQLDNAGLRIAALARKSGVPDSTIRSYARGKRQPTADNATKLAAALGVTVDYLLTGREPEAPRVDRVDRVDEDHQAKAFDAVRQAGGRVMTPYKGGAAPGRVTEGSAQPIHCLDTKLSALHDLMAYIWTHGDTAARRELRGALEEIADKLRDR